MLRAFAAFLEKGYDAKLVLLGRGEEEENLRALAAELGIRRRVDFAGFVVNVEDYLANADVFLLSSDFEALPLALLEAMAAGLPIVATDVGGVRDLMHHDEEGIVYCPGDVQALADGIMQLFALEDRAADMGGAAEKHAWKTHDPEKNLRDLMEIYQTIC
jgi:glycosyltransferase involved in cell wall biosynthesis